MKLALKALTRAVTEAAPARVTRRAATWWMPLALLGACASGPPVPDWQLEAHAALQAGITAHLSGNGRVATVEFERARRELARTGRIDLVARGELLRCAAHWASLENVGAPATACPAFEALRADAAPAELAYADFLRGTLEPARIALLPQAQQAAATAGHEIPRREAAIRAIEDPLSRLVAAAAMLRDGQATPGLVALAIDTASAQGWRRPLLAWLGLQKRRAEAAGDREAALALQRRIDLVTGSMPVRAGEAPAR